ncbi:MAG: SRPBCC family protein [Anaerolineae bacterium]|nr:SRPBCC family protein [Anaerolineae bacterium]
MRTIDHRILIPAPPDHIWAVVSDISRNPDWQIDCKEVIFLTSKRSGPGLRWRYSGDDRREFVYEVSAWYAGFGYEYYFVDGPTFRDARGRIRLQEVPEGTIVQWTFSYETGSVLGGMRISLGLHNSIDRLMQDSLRRLWQMLKADRTESIEHPSKSLMRDAPDVTARSAYQPRHVPHEGEANSRKSRTEAHSQPNVRPTPRQDAPLEPVVMHEDTRPNQPHIQSAMKEPDEVTLIPADVTGEPEFLGDLEEMVRYEPPLSAAETQPRSTRIAVDPVSNLKEQIPLVEPALAEVPISIQPIYGEEVPVAIDDTPARPIAAVTTTASTDLSSAPAETQPTPIQAEPSPLARTEQLATIGDTRSIWEIFNVPRPSETGEVEAVAGAVFEPRSPLPSLEDTPSKPIALSAGVRGLRQTIRRRIVRLRRLA